MEVKSVEKKKESLACESHMSIELVEPQDYSKLNMHPNLNGYPKEPQAEGPPR